MYLCRSPTKIRFNNFYAEIDSMVLNFHKAFNDNFVFGIK